MSVGEHESAVSGTDPPLMLVRALLLTDIVNSTKLTEELGDSRSAELFSSIDRIAREQLTRWGGIEVDRTDGHLFLFERAVSAVGCALEYHAALSRLSAEAGRAIHARVGIHLGELLLGQNPAEEIARGARAYEVEGLALPVAARVMSVCLGGQTLLTRAAFDLARRGAVGAQALPADLSWLAHGPYHFQGVDEPIELFEVGAPGQAPLTQPLNSEKVRRAVAPGEEAVLGWRPAPGQTIPGRTNFVLTEKLGEGGFGEVWLARHAKTRESRVFKFCFQADRLRGLKREVTLFRLLKETLGDRDDITRVLDWRFDQAPYYLELEHTDGGDLVDWAESKGGISQVPLQIRLELVAQVADALAAAHSVGVLHKDVKPSNILVVEGRDAHPRARLTDFGIGLVTDRERLLAQGITATGLTEMAAGSEPDSSRTGTRLYMAPELVEGKPATTLSDIYALGLVLYQVTVGDFGWALGSGWEQDVTDSLLRADIAACVDRRPERRLSSAADIAARLRSLETRRAELAAQAEADRLLHEEAERSGRAVEAAQRETARLKQRRKAVTIALIVSLVFAAIVSSLALAAYRQRGIAFAEQKNAVTARFRAEEASKRAATAEAKAMRAAAQLDRELYASNISLAQAATDLNNFSVARRALENCSPQFRGWEWGFLKMQTEQQLNELPKSAYRGVAINPDGNLVALTDGMKLQIGNLLLNNMLLGKTAAEIVPRKGIWGNPYWDKSGELLAVGDESGISIWRKSDRRIIQHLPYSRERGSTREISWTSNSAALLASDYAFLCAWDIASGKIIFERSLSEWTCTSAQWILSDECIFSKDRDNTCRVWSVRENRQLNSFKSEGAAIISPDGKTAAVVQSNRCELVDLSTSKVVSNLFPPNAVPIAWKPDGKGIVLASDYGNLLLCNTTPNNSPRYFFGHRKPVLHAAWSADEKMLVTGSADRTARVWDISNGNLVRTFRGHTAGVNQCEFAANGNLVVTAAYGDDKLRIWDVRNAMDGVILRTPDSSRSEIAMDGVILRSPDSSRSKIAWSRDGKNVAIRGSRADYHIFAASTGRELASTSINIVTQRFYGNSSIRSDFGRIAAASSSGTTILLWEGEGGTPLPALDGHTSTVVDLDWSPDGKLLASCSLDGTVRVWSGEANRIVFTESQKDSHRQVLRSADSLAQRDNGFIRIRWSPDGKWLAAGNRLATLVWSTRDWKLAGIHPQFLLQEWSPDSLRLSGVLAPGRGSHGTAAVVEARNPGTLRQLVNNGNVLCWSPDANKVLVQDTREEALPAQIFDAVTGRPTSAGLWGDEGNVQHAEWSRDGERIATGHSSGNVRVWDGVSGRLLSVFSTESPCTQVRWSPDGLRLATATYANGCRIWDIAPVSNRDMPGSESMAETERRELWKVLRLRSWVSAWLFPDENSDRSGASVAPPKILSVLKKWSNRDPIRSGSPTAIAQEFVAELGNALISEYTDAGTYSTTAAPAVIACLLVSGEEGLPRMKNRPYRISMFLRSWAQQVCTHENMTTVAAAAAAEGVLVTLINTSPTTETKEYLEYTPSRFASLATCLNKLHRKEDAIAAARRSVACSRAQEPNKSTTGFDTLLQDLGTSLAEVRRPDEDALEYADRVAPLPDVEGWSRELKGRLQPPWRADATPKEIAQAILAEYEKGAFGGRSRAELENMRKADRRVYGIASSSHITRVFQKAYPQWADYFPPSIDPRAPEAAEPAPK